MNPFKITYEDSSKISFKNSFRLFTHFFKRFFGDSFRGSFRNSSIDVFVNCSWDSQEISFEDFSEFLSWIILWMFLSFSLGTLSPGTHLPNRGFLWIFFEDFSNEYFWILPCFSSTLRAFSCSISLLSSYGNSVANLLKIYLLIQAFFWKFVQAFLRRIFDVFIREFFRGLHVKF